MSFSRLGVQLSVPGVIIFFLCFVAVAGGIRIAVRAVLTGGHPSQRKPVMIYGAGEAGRQLLESMNGRSKYKVVGFIDDDYSGARGRVSGVSVMPLERASRAIRRLGIVTIFLAIPSATRKRRLEIIKRLEPLNVRVRTVPDLNKILSGDAQVSQVRAFGPEDLLGRDPVEPNPVLMAKIIRDSVLMVTGAGGSIGSQVCLEILKFRPKRIIIVDTSEFSLYRIREMLVRHMNSQNCEIIASLANVQDQQTMQRIMEQNKVQSVFHCAAYKHVPLVEENIQEGISNNAFGTLCLTRAALAAKVKTVVLVSTDKAVDPSSIMGASKRLSELICIWMAQAKSDTNFSVVRFGNVIGSSGSVTPLFRGQIETGGPVTVTHPQTTRYFMTSTEAAQLVLQAGAIARGGDLFVLDMGEPVSILGLARRMVRLSGLRPFVQGSEATESGDVEIVFSGLRPGEKLHETLFYSEGSVPTEHPRILRETPKQYNPTVLKDLIEDLERACRSFDKDMLLCVIDHEYVGYRREVATTISLPAQGDGI